MPLRAVVASVGGLLGESRKARTSVESEVARAYGARDLLLTDSGTGALSLAIRACRAGMPDVAVALPAYSCYDLATAADGAGAPVLLYDVDPATLAPDAGSLRSALARGARVIVLVHLYGVPVDPAPIRTEAHRHGAWLIEDAAQGAGASIHGQPLGSFGDLAVLSFGRGKGNTAGRGGALLARDERGSRLLASARELLLPPARRLKDVVQLKAQWLLARPSLYAIPASLPWLRLGETIYRRPGPVRGLSAVAARTLAVTWALGEREAAVRRAHAERLLAKRATGLAPVRIPDGAQAGYLRLPFLASPRARSAAGLGEARRLGIMPGYPQALCDLAGFGERVLNRADAFSGARLLAQRLITLPTHSLLEEADMARLEAWLAHP